MLNIILDTTAPIKKSGKNNISMVAIANPPVDDKCTQCGKAFICAQESNKCVTPNCVPKPSTLMLKVKTEAECEKLFEHLKNPKVD